METWSVVVDGRDVALLWRTRDGGFAMRSGPSLVQPVLHYFSANEGVDGVIRYVRERFHGTPELVPR